MRVTTPRLNQRISEWKLDQVMGGRGVTRWMVPAFTVFLELEETELELELDREASELARALLLGQLSEDPGFTPAGVLSVREKASLGGRTVDEVLVAAVATLRLRVTVRVAVAVAVVVVVVVAIMLGEDSAGEGARRSAGYRVGYLESRHG